MPFTCLEYGFHIVLEYEILRLGYLTKDVQLKKKEKIIFICI